MTIIPKLPVNYDKLSRYQRRLVRLKYVEIQDGKCYHCGCLLDEQPSQQIIGKKINTKLFPDGFFNNPVHLHHSHVTGMTIGAVHAQCNAVLWQYYGE